MNNFLTFNVDVKYVSWRLDKFLFTVIEDKDIIVSRTAIQRLIESGMVMVNGVSKNKSYRLEIYDFIAVVLPPPKEYDVVGEDIPLDIVYEDSEFLVVNKPKDLVVHPGHGHETGTLVNAILYHCGEELSGISGVLRPGIVHRIDKDTSGLLVIAKSQISYASLSSQFFRHDVKREYHAICHGRLGDLEGTIDAAIARDKKDRKRFSVDDSGKPSITDYFLVENYDKYAYVKLRLHTGRTHQIRVHMAYIGHPLAGDTVYGPKSTPTQLIGQCLHAKTLAFTHPKTGEWMEFDSELPEYFTKFIRTVS
ncbi:MAG: RluA family pseudouridine synthase [Oscillospiraceae bacterium]|nr:RluA family pseudouridine synthase [Oscillospiraceae bacterium]